MMPVQRGKSLLLAAIVLISVVAAIGVTHKLTEQRIARNERAWFAAQLELIVPASLYDNDMLEDLIDVHDAAALGTDRSLPMYRARLKGRPTAMVMTSVAPDGYGGPIELLIGVDYEGNVLGVRILGHHETQGMGNDFELPGNHWLESFVGRSLNNPDSRGWNVHKDGGEFAQFTSATITPRAIVHAVSRTLDFYQHHRDELYQ